MRRSEDVACLLQVMADIYKQFFHQGKI